MNDETDRRGYIRVPHRAYATLTTAHRTYPAHLINISQLGALIAIIDDYDITLGQDVTLQVDSDDRSIELVGQVAHIKDDYIGLECSTIDEDSDEALEELIREIHNA